jgi:cytochrome c-type biogenesis protein CcmE
MLLPQKKWQKKIISISFLIVVVSIGVALILKAFNDNIVYFYAPNELDERIISSSGKLRIGGLVKEGSVFFDERNMHLTFVITDNLAEVKVTYHGIPPNLFAENQGTVVLGKFAGDKFIAQELLAKHDENYMPKEVYEQLRNKSKEIKKNV